MEQTSKELLDDPPVNGYVLVGSGPSADFNVNICKAQDKQAGTAEQYGAHLADIAGYTPTAMRGARWLKQASDDGYSCSRLKV